MTDVTLIAKFNQAFVEMGVLPEETENNNQHNPKWTLTAMEKYMRDQGDSSIALGLVAQPSPGTNASNKRKPFPVQSHPGHHLIASLQNGTDALESGGEESSPSWASSSTGNTPSYGSAGLAFEFSSKSNDDAFEKTMPIITTTSCTPKSTPENVKKVMPLSLSTDLLSALDTDLEYSKVRKSRKDSQSSVKSEDSKGTPTKTSKLRKLLRRTRSAGCSKDVSNSSHFSKEKAPVTKTKSADSAPCSREDGDEKLKKSSRKTLAQDMKMRLSFLRRRHTDSSLQPSSVRPSPEEASKWAESFQELTNSKYGLTLFRAFLSREFSEENIDFWLACEDYKRSRPNKLQAKARKIYDDFVAVQAPKEVNLDSSMRADIYNHLQNPDRHSFDSAQRRIQGLMEQDAYGRFLQSDLYKDLTQGNSTNTSS